MTTFNTSVNANACPIDIQQLRGGKYIIDPSLRPLSRSDKLSELATQQLKQVKVMNIEDVHVMSPSAEVTTDTPTEWQKDNEWQRQRIVCVLPNKQNHI